ncbi:hypothetical protein M885DRAFT_13784 [Pelagophyceae sp. CCMP2097]|nr:hypothetical protein M885DRAFT_13784 [Pelagophyceae sp. CCMP2097]
MPPEAPLASLTGPLKRAWTAVRAQFGPLSRRCGVEPRNSKGSAPESVFEFECDDVAEGDPWEAARRSPSHAVPSREGDSRRSRGPFAKTPKLTRGPKGHPLQRPEFGPSTARIRPSTDNGPNSALCRQRPCTIRRRHSADRSPLLGGSGRCSVGLWTVEYGRVRSSTDLVGPETALRVL